MADEIRADEPVEGEYTDSELPADAALPKDSDAVNDGDWDGAGGEVVVDDADVVIVEDGEYTDTDFDADGRPERA